MKLKVELTDIFFAIQYSILHYGYAHILRGRIIVQVRDLRSTSVKNMLIVKKTKCAYGIMCVIVINDNLKKTLFHE